MDALLVTRPRGRPRRVTGPAQRPVVATRILTPPPTLTRYQARRVVALPDAVTLPAVPAACPRCHAQAFRSLPPEVVCRTCGWAVVLLEPVPT